ncbi:RNA-directed DNA polymerase, eukaryota, reverse transcriptase zinc-binding domain protein [Tanacetum coccineum]
MDLNLAAWNIRGLGNLTKQNEVRNLIRNERLNICSVLETHMKNDIIGKVCMNVFGSWFWQNNVSLSRKGCRIVVGWDASNVKCTLINATEQSMIIGNSKWVIMGDVNVSLNMEDQSEDRVMGNNAFLSKFSTANVLFLPYGISNHSPTILKFPQAMKKKNMSFRLASYVIDKVEFKELVREKWNIEVHGHHMHILQLLDVQRKIYWDPTNKVLRSEGVELLKNYTEAALDEEKLLRKKQKLLGSVKGTRILHISIKFLKEELTEEVLCLPAVIRLNDDDVHMFANKIFEEEANNMIREINEAKIKKALFDNDDEKAPAIKEFFRTGKMLGEINATLISLVPKSQTPQKVSDFRPIACCNVIYKCISKIPTNIIKSALNQIVDENQSAFVLRRAIIDNILLTQELLKGYNCINGPQRCSFKIDIQKAYDTLRITHLCFADDLIMLCHGDIVSVKTLKKALDKFSAISGLYPNLGKCTMFCGSIDDATKNNISNIFLFKEGKLPVRYLGIPLVTKKIGVADSQLIASVLGSMQIYWGSVFLLPKAVINEIKNSKDSWGWKCLLILRSWVGKHMRYKIGDGKSISVWHDKWYNATSISSVICKKKFFYAGFSDLDKISDVFDSNGWKWPLEWMTKYHWIKDIKNPTLSNSPDTPIWVDNNGNERRFSTSIVCKDVNCDNGKVSWRMTVWHPNCIPKHTFILWHVVKKRLCTQDRMANWYPSRVFECSLCKKEPASHDHLFFNCEYAQKVWKMICNMARIQFKVNTWVNLVESLSSNQSRRNRREANDLTYIMIEELKAKMMSIAIKNSNNVIAADLEC